MNLTPITIRVHSFVDIITNSSSEIFVEANQNTINNVKNLVNSLLSLAGSKSTCDDLFELELVNQNEEYEEEGYEPEYPRVDLKVTPKVSDNDAEIAAKILSGLTDIFNIESTYNG